MMDDDTKFGITIIIVVAIMFTSASYGAKIVFDKQEQLRVGYYGQLEVWMTENNISKKDIEIFCDTYNFKLEDVVESNMVRQQIIRAINGESKNDLLSQRIQNEKESEANSRATQNFAAGFVIGHAMHSGRR